MTTPEERFFVIEDTLKEIFEECENEIEFWEKERGKACPADAVYITRNKIKSLLNI